MASNQVTMAFSTRRLSTQDVFPVRAPAGVTADAYRLFPTHELAVGRIDAGFEVLAQEIKVALAEGRTVVLDGVAATFWDDITTALKAVDESLAAETWIDVRNAMRPSTEIEAMLLSYLPEGDIFGHRFDGSLVDFFGTDALAELHEQRSGNPRAIVFGPGASLSLPDALADTSSTIVYFDVARNEQQYRARAGHASCLGREDSLEAKTAYRQAYFVDWVVEQAHLAQLLPNLARFVDAQRIDTITSISGEALRAGLSDLAAQPFRVRPWFEPGVWGGQWIKRMVPGINPDVPNYAWSFELIVPENGVLLSAEGVLLEVPYHALHAQEYRAILGQHAERFRELFPIRFDWLDTVEGGNLSLQCHPRPDYMRREFGEPFTQDETYYILHAEEQAEVFLGFKEGIDPQQFREALEVSAAQGSAVEVTDFVQSHPARRGDLFLIPSGTVHCSGEGSLVLEISATPYIFTFKMYDWLRTDLDGRPRPLSIERAFENLDFSRQGEAVRETLLAHPVVLSEQDAGRVVHLPTHPEHFYDVHRLELSGTLTVRTDGSPHVLAVVRGARVRVEVNGSSWDYAFAETFVIPAGVEAYTLTPLGTEPVEVIKAFLK